MVRRLRQTIPFFPLFAKYRPEINAPFGGTNVYEYVRPRNACFHLSIITTSYGARAFRLMEREERGTNDKNLKKLQERGRCSVRALKALAHLNEHNFKILS